MRIGRLLATTCSALVLSGCAGTPQPSAPPATVTTPASVPATIASTPSAAPSPVAAAPERAANLVPVLYRQFDDAWAKLGYGERPDDTIRRWGCGPAAMAMAVATLRDPSVDPASAAEWALQGGYFTHRKLSGKTTDGFFTDYGNHYGLRVTAVNTGDLRTADAGTARLAHAEALQAVKDGNWVVALMGVGPWTTEAHYVLWYDAPGDEVLIHDSNSPKPAKARNSHALFTETVMRYWIIDVDRSEPAA